VLINVLRYNVSKMIELLGIRELATSITNSSKPGDIVVSVINPGFVETDIMREASFLFSLYVKGLSKMLSRTPEVGGRILVNAAEGGKETHGQYLDDCKVGQ
jgi:retinol dehydrogenase-12